MISYHEVQHPDSPSGVVVLALDDNTTPAAAIIHYPFEDNKRLIHFVYVAPAYRGQGLYAELVRYIRIRFPFRVAVTPHIPTAAALWYTLLGVEVIPGERLDQGDLAAARARRRAQEANGAETLARIAAAHFAE